MHPAEKIPEPWLSFLNELDAEASGQVRLDCLGGFGEALLGGENLHRDRLTQAADSPLAGPVHAIRFTSVADSGRSLAG